MNYKQQTHDILPDLTDSEKADLFSIIENEKYEFLKKARGRANALSYILATLIGLLFTSLILLVFYLATDNYNLKSDRGMMQLELIDCKSKCDFCKITNNS